MPTWTHPQALWLLAVVPLLAALAARSVRLRRRALARFGVPTPARQGLLAGACVLTAAGLLAAAAAGPLGRPTADGVPASGRDLVVLVDLSNSMLADDVLPSRLARARASLLALADAARRRPGHRLALVGFAAGSRVLCPLTQDVDHFRSAVAELDDDFYPADIRTDPKTHTSGTRIGAALVATVALFDDHTAGCGDVLLLSDGDDPAGDSEWRSGIAAARTDGARIFTVGIGDPEGDTRVPGTDRGTRLCEAPLREIADATGGEYLPAGKSWPALGDFFRRAIDGDGRRRELHLDPLPVPPARAAWFVAPALLLLSAGLWGVGRATPQASTSPLPSPTLVSAPVGRGGMSLSLLALLLVSAGPGLPHRPANVDAALACERAADAAFAAGDFARAADLYALAAERTPEPGRVAFNRGVALARLGRHGEAADHFRRCRDEAGPRLPAARYNLAASLLEQAGPADAALLREAADALADCLATNPDPGLAADARSNLELARIRWLAAVADRPPPERGGDGPPRDDPRPEDGKPGDSRPGDPRKRPDRKLTGPAETADPSAGEPAATDRDPPPGKGNLPVLPDTEERATLSADEARAHLERAGVRAERARRPGRGERPAKPTTDPVRDW